VPLAQRVRVRPVGRRWRWRAGLRVDAAATATLPPACAAVDRAVAAATDAHVVWWRAWTRRRARVVDEAAEAGLARAKVLRILDALGEER